MSAFPRQAGVTYIALLFFVALMSIAATSTANLWVTTNQRSKERELLFVGAQFRSAVERYYEETPGTVKRYPTSLADLLKDDRHLQTVRHLRRIHVDPMTGVAEWGEVRAPDGGIMGVFSLGDGTPRKQAGFDPELSAFVDATSYAEWKFVYISPLQKP